MFFRDASWGHVLRTQRCVTCALVSKKPCIESTRDRPSSLTNVLATHQCPLNDRVSNACPHWSTITNLSYIIYNYDILNDKFDSLV